MRLRIGSPAATQRKIGRALGVVAVVCALALVIGLIRGRGRAEAPPAHTGPVAAETPTAGSDAGSETATPGAGETTAGEMPAREVGRIEETGAAAPGTGEALPEDPNRVELETFTIIVPPGWERVRQSGEDVVLYLVGPDLGQERLRLAISVRGLAPRQTLDQFADAYCADLSAQPLLMDERVNLGGRPARLVKFVNTDGLNHVLLSVYKQRAHVVAMVSPGGEGSDDLSTFNRVMQTFQYRE